MTSTGILEVVGAGGTRTRHEWNGAVEDRDAARAAFDKAVSEGGLAIVHDAPRRGHQVRDFAEVEEVERERGVVEVSVRPAIQGG